MQWYLNDLSLQGQYEDINTFKALLVQLLSAINTNPYLTQNLRTPRTLTQSLVCQNTTFRDAIKIINDKELTAKVLNWLDKHGPFIEDDRLDEAEDYFEYENYDVTNLALGEAARRVKANFAVSSYSFVGGGLNFSKTPLPVNHGVPGDRLGVYDVDNLWSLEALQESALEQGVPIQSWASLIDHARIKFPTLYLPDSILGSLAKEPFNTVIKDAALVQMQYLHTYMINRGPNGEENNKAKEIVDNFFTGARAIFTGESSSNQRDFKSNLTFKDPEDNSKEIFAHWHGKISHRFYRMHFEWPLASNSTKLKILFLGPKITKD